MMSILTMLAACMQPGALPGAPPTVVTLTDPEGIAWAVQAQGQPVVVRFEGPDCGPATWFTVQAGTPQLFAWFAVPGSTSTGPPPVGSPVAFDPSTRIAAWNVDADPVTYIGSDLFGGIGQVLDASADRLEYQITDGQDCTVIATTTAGSSYDCVDQAGPVTILIEGQDLPYDTGPTETGDVGWATDPDTGDPICGGPLPGI